MKLRRLLTLYKKEEKEISSITGLNPYLKFLSEYLLSQQEEDGSWNGDPLLTSFALRAIYNLSKILDLDSDLFSKAIKKGRCFLEQELEKKIPEILESRDLYPLLDWKIIIFSNIFYTFNLVNGYVKDNYTLAYLKLSNALLKWYRALDNIEAICSLLSCLEFNRKYDIEGLDKLLEYLIERVLSWKLNVRDMITAIYCLQKLSVSKYSKALEKVWDSAVRKRSDRYKNLPLYTGLRKLVEEVIEKMLLEKVDNFEILGYALLILTTFKRELNKNDKNTNLEEKIMQYLISLLDRVSIKDLSLYDISILIQGFSLSQYRNVVFFPLHTEKEIKNAIDWYIKKQKDIKILPRKRYYILAGLSMSFIITLIIIGFFYPRIESVVGIIVSIILFLFSIFRE